MIWECLPENMHLVLDLDRDIAELFKYLSEEGERRGFTIGVSDRMEATLKGEAFQVNAINLAEQPIVGGQSTEWRWQVTPSRVGEHYLFLTLNAFLEVRGVEKAKTVRTFDQKIDVVVRPIGERAEEFVSHNWQWLWTVVLTPIAVKVLSGVRKRRHRV